MPPPVAITWPGRLQAPRSSILFFQTAKIGFALSRENLADLASLGFLDQRIQIDETAAQSAREVAPDGALSHRHEADQGDVFHLRFQGLVVFDLFEIVLVVALDLAQRVAAEFFQKRLGDFEGDH